MGSFRSWLAGRIWNGAEVIERARGIESQPQLPRRPRSGHVVSLGNDIAGRAFAGAKRTDITQSMATQPKPFDGDIYRSLNILRARSREEYQSNDYAKRAVTIIKQNVIGHNGIGIQSDVRRRNGDKDKPASDSIEASFKEFGKRGTPDVTRRLSWLDIQNLFVHSIVVDGEVIIVKREKWTGNKFGYALQFIDPVLLDMELNEELDGGRKIRMGVELDQHNAPIAYHFLNQEVLKDDYNFSTFARRSHQRIVASEVLHAFMPEAVFQTRGVPILSTSLIRFNMLRGYEDAELVAARTAAAKMGFFIDAETGDRFEGDAIEGEPGEEENYMDAAEPGRFGRLPHGVAFESYDPQHPNAAFKDYAKAVLRGAAAGMNVPYNAMANDLEGVNFSSLRAGNMDAHDGWRAIQVFVRDSLCDWVFPSWVRISILNQAIEIRPGVPLNLAMLDRYLVVKWNPRTWDHVQPLEQAKADALRVETGSHSLSELIRARGRDPDDVYRERAEDKAIHEKLNLNYGPESETSKEPEPELEDEDGEGDSGSAGEDDSV